MERYHTKPPSEVVLAQQQVAVPAVVDSTSSPLLLQLARQSKWHDDFAIFERAVRRSRDRRREAATEDDVAYRVAFAGTPYEQEKDPYVQYARLLSLDDIRNVCVELGLKGLFLEDGPTRRPSPPADLVLSRDPIPAYYDVPPAAERSGLLYSDTTSFVRHACCFRPEGSPGCWVKFNGHDGPYQVWFELVPDLWQRLSEETISQAGLEELIRTRRARGLVFLEEAKCEVIHKAIVEFLEANANGIAQTYFRVAQELEEGRHVGRPSTLDPLLNLLRYYNRTSNLEDFKGDPWQIVQAKQFYSEELRAFAKNAQGDRVKLLVGNAGPADIARVRQNFPQTDALLNQLVAAQSAATEAKALQLAQKDVLTRFNATDARLDRIGWRKTQMESAGKRLREIDAAERQMEKIATDTRRAVNAVAKGKQSATTLVPLAALPTLFEGDLLEMEAISQGLKPVKDLTEKDLRTALLRDGDFVPTEAWFSFARTAYALQTLSATSEQGKRTLQALRDDYEQRMAKEEVPAPREQPAPRAQPKADVPLLQEDDTEFVRKLINSAPTVREKFFALKKLRSKILDLRVSREFQRAFELAVRIGFLDEWNDRTVKLLLDALAGSKQAVTDLNNLTGIWETTNNPNRLAYRLANFQQPPVSANQKIVPSNFAWYQNSCPYDALFCGLFKNPGLLIEERIRRAMFVYPQVDEAHLSDAPDTLHAMILYDMRVMQDEKYDLKDKDNCLTPQAWRNVLAVRNENASKTDFADDAVALASSLMFFYDIPHFLALRPGNLKDAPATAEVVIANYDIVNAPPMKVRNLELICLLVFIPGALGHWYAYVRDLRQKVWWVFDALSQRQQMLGPDFPVFNPAHKTMGAIYGVPPPGPSRAVDDFLKNHVEASGKPFVRNDGYDVVRKMASENLGGVDAMRVARMFLLREDELRAIRALKK